MRLIGLLIGLAALAFLVYALVGDYTGAKKGDGKERILNQVKVTEDIAKKVSINLGNQEKNIERELQK